MPVPSSAKRQTAFQSALIAGWALFWSALSTNLANAFLQGAFATPERTLIYFKTNWWTLLISSVFGIIIGGGVRAQQKANYVGRVDAGKETAPQNPVIAPSGTTIASPDASTIAVPLSALND